jgi:ribose transport system substrate-binding protein
MRLAAALFLLSLAACRPDAKRVVGVVPKGASHLFFQTVHAGAIKAAQEEGLRIEWNAPPTEIDTSRQIEIVDSMVNRRLAGIALAPVDRQALVSVVERAAAAGVPVAIFDSEIDTRKRICYIATNNEEAGRIAARRLGEVLGGKGKVAIIGFKPGGASTMEREAGFQDEIAKRFPGIQIVALQYGLADRAKSMAVTENILTGHPDLAGLYADNEASTGGATQALKGRGQRNVKLVAMDTSDQIVQDLRDGWIEALIVQDPFRMGYESVKAIAGQLAGRKPPEVLDTGVSLILRDQLDQPAVKALLFPDVARWLKQ